MEPTLQNGERFARSAIEDRYGRPLSDEEWEQATYALLEFARLLRDWQEKRKERAA